MPNRNSEDLIDFLQKNGFVCLNTKFQNKTEKAIDLHPNNSKTPRDYIFINN